MIILVWFFLKITLLYCCWWGSFCCLIMLDVKIQLSYYVVAVYFQQWWRWMQICAVSLLDLRLAIAFFISSDSVPLMQFNMFQFRKGAVPIEVGVVVVVVAVVVAVVVVCCWCCVAVVFAREIKPRHLCGCCRSCCCCVLIKLSSAAVWYDFSVCSGGGGRVHDEVHWFRWYGGSCW